MRAEEGVEAEAQGGFGEGAGAGGEGCYVEPVGARRGVSEGVVEEVERGGK